ncbi:hypothetical protein L208DRAFT_1392661 [Tricholoma matsutake]|nr:hypothetical protein L208DRAFT_1392661 [Tricholoma matsutake 945]
MSNTTSIIYLATGVGSFNLKGLIIRINLHTPRMNRSIHRTTWIAERLQALTGKSKTSFGSVSPGSRVLGLMKNSRQHLQILHAGLGY